MCFNEFKETYKTNTNYLLYMGLIQATPTKYKHMIAKNLNNETHTKKSKK